MNDLNEIEEKVFRELFKSSEGNGHNFGFTDEVNTDAIGITRRQLSGYISQLAQKDYIHVFNSDDHKEFIQFQFTKKDFLFFGLTGYAEGSE
jgi:hypothetical protein